MKPHRRIKLRRSWKFLASLSPPSESLLQKGEQADMRKAYKRKRRSCALCQPHKVGWDTRWKAREAARRTQMERDCRHPTPERKRCQEPIPSEEKWVRSSNPPMTERRRLSPDAFSPSGISRCRLSCQESRPCPPRLLARLSGLSGLFGSSGLSGFSGVFGLSGSSGLSGLSGVLVIRSG